MACIKERWERRARIFGWRVSWSAFGSMPFLILVLCLRFDVGPLVYNLYHLSALRHFRSLAVDNMRSVPSMTHNLLHCAARLGSRRAAADIVYFIETIGPDWSRADPLLHYLGSRGLIARRLGWELPDAVWDLARYGSTRIEAEKMTIAGAATPNPYAAIETRDDRSFVVLYWQHNYLRTSIVVPATGSYRVTVNASDWPPPPFRLRVGIGEQSKLLVWTQGDHAWHEQTAVFALPRGVLELDIHFAVEPGDDPVQDAHIDWLTLERVE